MADGKQPPGEQDGNVSGAADAFSPPERDRRLRRNPAMSAVVVVVAVAVVVFVLVRALG